MSVLMKCCCAIGLGFLAGAAAAQMFSPGYAVTGAPMSNFLSSSYLTQSVSNDLARSADVRRRPMASSLGPSRSADADTAGLKARTSGPSLMPARLAQHYPPAQRPQARALFEDLLSRYAQIERRFALPRGDLPGAVAAFLAGSYMGLHNTDFPDAQFEPVVQQMRAILAAEPRLRTAPDAEKREMYEQMAILGMLMAGTQMGLKQQADPATERAMRAAARSYLEQFLKTDADRVQLTADGLVLR